MQMRSQNTDIRASGDHGTTNCQENLLIPLKRHAISKVQKIKKEKGKQNLPIHHLRRKTEQEHLKSRGGKIPWSQKDVLHLQLTRGGGDNLSTRDVDRKPSVSKDSVCLMCMKYHKSKRKRLDSQESCYTPEEEDVPKRTSAGPDMPGEEAEDIIRPPTASHHKR